MNLANLLASLPGVRVGEAGAQPGRKLVGLQDASGHGAPLGEEVLFTFEEVAAALERGVEESEQKPQMLASSPGHAPLFPNWNLAVSPALLLSGGAKNDSAIKASTPNGSAEAVMATLAVGAVVEATAKEGFGGCEGGAATARAGARGGQGAAGTVGQAATGSGPTPLDLSERSVAPPSAEQGKASTTAELRRQGAAAEMSRPAPQGASLPDDDVRATELTAQTTTQAVSATANASAGRVSQPLTEVAGTPGPSIQVMGGSGLRFGPAESERPSWTPQLRVPPPDGGPVKVSDVGQAQRASNAGSPAPVAAAPRGYVSGAEASLEQETGLAESAASAAITAAPHAGAEPRKPSSGVAASTLSSGGLEASRAEDGVPTGQTIGETGESERGTIATQGRGETPLGRSSGVKVARSALSEAVRRTVESPAADTDDGLAGPRGPADKQSRVTVSRQSIDVADAPRAVEAADAGDRPRTVARPRRGDGVRADAVAQLSLTSPEQEGVLKEVAQALRVLTGGTPGRASETIALSTGGTLELHLDASRPEVVVQAAGSQPAVVENIEEHLPRLNALPQEGGRGERPIEVAVAAREEAGSTKVPKGGGQELVLVLGRPTDGEGENERLGKSSDGEIAAGDHALPPRTDGSHVGRVSTRQPIPVHPAEPVSDGGAPLTQAEPSESHWATRPAGTKRIPGEPAETAVDGALTGSGSTMPMEGDDVGRPHLAWGGRLRFVPAGPERPSWTPRLWMPTQGGRSMEAADAEQALPELTGGASPARGATTGKATSVGTPAAKQADAAEASVDQAEDLPATAASAARTRSPHEEAEPPKTPSSVAASTTPQVARQTSLGEESAADQGVRVGQARGEARVGGSDDVKIGGDLTSGEVLSSIAGAEDESGARAARVTKPSEKQSSKMESRQSIDVADAPRAVEAADAGDQPGSVARPRRGDGVRADAVAQLSLTSPEQEVVLKEVAQALRVLTGGTPGRASETIALSTGGTLEPPQDASQDQVVAQVTGSQPAVVENIEEHPPRLNALLQELGRGERPTEVAVDAREGAGATKLVKAGGQELVLVLARATDGEEEGERLAEPRDGQIMGGDLALPRRVEDTNRSKRPVDGTATASQTAIGGESVGGLRQTQGAAAQSVTESNRVESHLSTRQQGDLLDQVVRAAKMLTVTHQESATISLNPPSLGRVELQVTVNEGKALIQIVAEQSGTRDALALNLPQLRGALMDQGLASDALSVSIGSSAGGSSWMSQSAGHDPGRQGRLPSPARPDQSASTPTLEREPRTARAAWSSGSIDLYA